MPTIFSFSKGKEEQPRGKTSVSINEASDSPISVVNSNEEVAHVDNVVPTVLLPIRAMS